MSGCLHFLGADHEVLGAGGLVVFILVSDGLGAFAPVAILLFLTVVALETIVIVLF